MATKRNTRGMQILTLCKSMFP